MQVASKGSAMDADAYGNSGDVEATWAMQAMDHAECHMSLLLSGASPRWLTLSPFDNYIYKDFRATFPKLRIDMINEEDLKSEKAKTEWRSFCQKYEKIVDNYNLGVLIRQDCRGEYSEENSIFAIRIQWLAIEIARNREGFNDGLTELFPFKPQEEVAAEEKAAALVDTEETASDEYANTLE